jgi:glucosamine--fructose-6-phosphate aminotransferase (isomerizing)
MIDSINRTPVIIIVVKDNFYDDMVTSLHQVIARNAFVILLTNCKNSIDTSKVDYCIELPEEGLMSSYYAVFAGQLIAYYIAISKGYNPDKPRNLSKELTTK